MNAKEKKVEELTRRRFVKIMGLSAAAAALPKTVSARGSRRRPNILFVMADDHTSQAIGCYGLRLSEYAPTKNIDRIAAEGAPIRSLSRTTFAQLPGLMITWADPWERFNQYGNPEHNDVIAGMKRRLDELREQFRDFERITL